MRVIVDAMGGDHGPSVVIQGAVDAIKEFPLAIVLVGLKDQLDVELKKHSYPRAKIEIVHAPEVVGMDDPPTVSIRKKRNSSISVGMDLLKEGKADAFISAGNTGAVVCASTFILGMIPGVERPAIGLTIPTLQGHSFLIDVGANADPKAEHLLQSSLMAKVYSKEVLGVKNPSIALLNIGEEEGKGSDFHKEAYKLMSGRLENFFGNIEANELFKGKCDCIICDGFVGNVCLKVAEGLAESAGALIKREIKKSPLAILGALIMKSRLMHIKKLVDYSEYGGAPLLGVNGVVMICHGRSNSKAIRNAIRAAIQEAEHQVVAQIAQEVSIKK